MAPWRRNAATVFALFLLCALPFICLGDSPTGSMANGDNLTPAEMATELGKYKQYVYSVVGSYWYPDVNQNFSQMPLGLVQVQFTIHSDGTVNDMKVLKGDNLGALTEISLHAVKAPAPYKPFSAALIKETGNSFTHSFTFTVKS